MLPTDTDWNKELVDLNSFATNLVGCGIDDVANLVWVGGFGRKCFNGSYDLLGDQVDYIGFQVDLGGTANKQIVDVRQAIRESVVELRVRVPGDWVRHKREEDSGDGSKGHGVCLGIWKSFIS